MTDPVAPPSTGLVRARLLPTAGGPLDRLTVVTAPAGSGKTTLLTQRAAASDVDVAWLRLGPADVDPARLARNLGRALAEVRPGCAGLDDLEVIAETVREDDVVLLVVDDLHHLVGSAAERALEGFLTGASPVLRTVLAGRRAPRMNLCRHELGPVGVVGPDDLRFRTWEVERLFRDVYAEPLPPADAAVLTRRVGGWAAGLQMFRLSTRGRSRAERGEAARALDGRLAMSQAYLARTVLADLPDDVRDFLVRTCVFHAPTSARCDALLGRDGSARLLAWLADRQAFIHTPDQGRSYRYHEALRLHLDVALVEMLGEQDALAWHGRAAAILEADDAPMEALRSYARAAQWPAVRRILARLGPDVADEPWSDLLPGWLVAEEPGLLIAEGRHRLGQGRVDAAAASFGAAVSSARHPAVIRHAQEARNLAAVWQRPVAGAGAGDGVSAHWSDAVRAALRRRPGTATAGTADLPEPTARLVRAVGAMLAGDLAAARRLVGLTPESGSTFVDLALDLVRAALRCIDDRDTGCGLDEVATAADGAGQVWLSRTARAALALGGTEAARKEARRIAEECERDGDAWGSLLAAALASVGALRDGVPDLDGLGAVAALARRVDAEVVAVWADAMTVRASAPSATTARRARSVAARARAVGVPGAAALADAACRPSHDPPPRPTAPSSSTVVVRCLGSFAIEVDGAPLDLDGLRPRARAVLRLLAVRWGEPVHREHLLATLWPDASAASATRSLHVALSSVRSVLGGDAGLPRVRRTGDAYLLDPAPGTRCDVDEFTRLLAGASRAGDADTRARALRAALDAYRGDLLPEDGPAEWVVPERDRLQRAAAGAAAGLAELELARDRAVAAVAAASRCVELDDCHDAGWRLLAAAYWRLGDAMAVTRTERRYGEMLVALGVVDAGP